jgi:hypothetical protein
VRAALAARDELRQQRGDGIGTANASTTTMMSCLGVRIGL